MTEGMTSELRPADARGGGARFTRRLRSAGTAEVGVRERATAGSRTGRPPQLELRVRLYWTIASDAAGSC